MEEQIGQGQTTEEAMEARAKEVVEPTPVKRGRGRPKGSKNKKFTERKNAE